MKFEPTIKEFTPDQMRYIVTLVESTMTAAIEATKKKAANLAYAVCAETRHVTLGDKCATAIRSME